MEKEKITRINVGEIAYFNRDKKNAEVVWWK